uniref:Uncharacterized protein n=1 Tax=Anopheles atroparvus TaxID=41427 RepID=A0A182JJL8_ANOAO
MLLHGATDRRNLLPASGVPGVIDLSPAPRLLRVERAFLSPADSVPCSDAATLSPFDAPSAAAARPSPPGWLAPSAPAADWRSCCMGSGLSLSAWAPVAVRTPYTTSPVSAPRFSSTTMAGSYVSPLLSAWIE